MSSGRIVRNPETVDNGAHQRGGVRRVASYRNVAFPLATDLHSKAMNITDPLRQQAQLHPARIAVIRLGGFEAGYGDLDRTIDVLAQRLLDLGLRPGQTAMIGITAPYMYLALALALARIGVASATTNHPSAACAVCFAPEGVSTIDGLRMIAVDAGWFRAPDPQTQVPPVPSHQDGAAICAYFDSSGTTGVPKHIGISHDLMTRRIAVKARNAPLPAESRQIFAVGPRGAYGFRDTLRVLGQGGLVVFTLSPEDLFACIERYQVNYLVIAPAVAQRLAAERPAGASPFPSLAIIEVGGSHLPHAVWQAARVRLCPNILSTYGASETGSVAGARMEDLINHPAAVGHVYADVEVQAVDADDQPLPAGVEGIVRIRSDTCVDHYFNDPIATAAAFRNGWFYPGDTGSVSADGRLDITGRTSEVINNGGDKISPLVIEDVLRAQRGIIDAAAFGVPDADGMMKIWAAVVAQPHTDITAVMTGCRAQLQGRAPKFIITVAELPRNEGGKVVREALVKMARERQGSV